MRALIVIGALMLAWSPAEAFDVYEELRATEMERHQRYEWEREQADRQFRQDWQELLRDEQRGLAVLEQQRQLDEQQRQIRQLENDLRYQQERW